MGLVYESALKYFSGFSISGFSSVVRSRLYMPKVCGSIPGQGNYLFISYLHLLSISVNRWQIRTENRWQQSQNLRKTQIKSKQKQLEFCEKKLYFSTISMPVEISHDKAYQDYLSIRKPGLKSATIENISAILQQNDVEINPKPSNPVSFYYKFGRINLCLVK